MSRATLPFRRLICHLLWLVLFYFCCRLAFCAFNASSFPKLNGGTLMLLLVEGMRFDLSAIFMCNILFILLILLPLPVLKFRWYNLLLKIIFLVTNSIAFLFEAADWIYFPFNHKRSTAEVLDIVTTKGDFFNLLPGFFKDYWYIFLIGALLIVLLAYTYRLTELAFRRKATLSRILPGKPKSLGWKGFIIRFFLLLVGATMTVIGIRGGLQYVPIGIRTAVSMARSEFTPILLNTPFSIIKSVEKHRLPIVHYMPESQAVATLHPIKYFGNKQSGFRADNVVLIILESFSKEFTGLPANTVCYTPFLDSLMNKGMMFTNAYANALHSAEGVPAVIAGVPSLMEEYYSLSPYTTNKIDAFPYLLKKMGYRTAFYHGGTNGTMGFDDFAAAAGYDHYYGRTQYDNDKDYDGNWGIFDEPFLQYFAHGLDTMKQPFMASVFTVTSHPPYPLPAKYKGKFPTGKLAIDPCVGYTDMAVRKFFEAVKNKPWFKHTIFIITPDHCSPLASNAYYSYGTGRYQIPIIFYAPGDTTLRGYNHTLIQQIDILPSVMDYLHYPDSFFCLGNSVFRPQAHRFVINRLNGVYNWINDGYQSFLFEDTLKKSYTFPQDSLRRHNLLQDNPHFRLSPKSKMLFQSFVQIYNQAMNNNAMTRGNFDKLLHRLKHPKVSTHPSKSSVSSKVSKLLQFEEAPFRRY